jgi:hypothetical protein
VLGVCSGGVGRLRLRLWWKNNMEYGAQARGAPYASCRSGYMHIGAEGLRRTALELCFTQFSRLHSPRPSWIPRFGPCRTDHDHARRENGIGQAPPPPPFPPTPTPSHSAPGRKAGPWSTRTYRRIVLQRTLSWNHVLTCHIHSTEKARHFGIFTLPTFAKNHASTI